MRQFKFLLAAFAFMLTTSTFANLNSDYKVGKESTSYEIQEMLYGSDFITDEDFTVKVFFKVTEDNRIAIQRVNSPIKEVNEYLMKRLENQKLNSSSFDSEKVYVLPVKVQSRR